MADKVEVQISAQVAGLIAGMQQASTAVKEGAEQMRSSLDTLASMGQKLTAVFAGLAALTAGGRIFGDVVEATTGWDLSVNKLAKSLGTSTEEASAYAVATQRLGIDTATLTTGAVMMSRQIMHNSEAFKKLGIEIRDAQGHFRPTIEVMKDALDVLRTIQNPIEQNIVGMQLFGRAWGEMRPLLRLTSDAIEQASGRAKELGLVVGKDNVAAARAFEESQKDLKLVGTSLARSIGQELLPNLTNFGTIVAQNSGAVRDVLVSALKMAESAIINLAAGFQALGTRLGAWAAAAGAALTGNFSGAREILKQVNEDIAEINRKADEAIAKLDKPPKPSGSSAPDLDNGPNLADQFLREAKAKETLEEEVARLARTERVRIEMKLDGEHEIQNALKETEKKADQYFKDEEQRLKESDRLYKIRTKELEQQFRDVQQAMQEILAPVAHAFEGAINSMVRGTQTFRQAMRSMGQQILSDFINLTLKLVERWAVKEISQTAMTESHTAIRKMLTSLGLIEEQTTTDATGVANVTAKKAEAVGSIPPEAAIAAVGAMQSVASIPYVGPVLAAAAYAETLATGLSALSIASAAGGYDIPAGLNPMVQTHAREMILPAKYADMIRDVTGNGGTARGRGGNVTFSPRINAIDGPSVSRLVQSVHFRRQLKSSFGMAGI